MKPAASKKRVSDPVSASEQDRRCLGPAGDAGGGGSATFGAEPAPNISLDLLSLEAGMGSCTAEAQAEERAREWHCQLPKA